MQFTIRMPDDYEGKIAKLSRKMGLKKSDIARMALKQFLTENLQDEDAAPFERVRHLLGAAESGVKDLGRRHRTHLINKLKRKTSR